MIMAVFRAVATLLLTGIACLNSFEQSQLKV